MTGSSASQGAAAVVRNGVAVFLAIAGVVLLVFGVLYLTAGRLLPHVIQGSSHSGHHVKRAAACLVVGALCAVVAWFIRARRRA